MNLSKKTILSIVLLAVLPCTLLAQEQTQTTREEYIDMYKGIAIAHMERYGIPASITLAQGILESSCGNSYLSRVSNNHFGTSASATGRARPYSMTTTPRANVSASTTPWRSRTSTTPSSSTSSRATTRCSSTRRPTTRAGRADSRLPGYATAPDYADRLIRIIEENKLYLLDREDGNKLYAEAHGATSEEIETAVAADGIDPDSYRVTINAHRGYNVYRTNNVCYIIAKEGDRYEHLASLFMVSPKNLRRFNDVAKDAQPKKGDIVFIERKRKRWEGNSLLHTVRQNETLYSLSQSYGIRLKSLAKLNGVRTDCKLNNGQSIKIR